MSQVLYCTSVCTECGNASICKARNVNFCDNSKLEVNLEECKECKIKNIDKDKQKVRDEITKSLEFIFSVSNGCQESIIEHIINRIEAGEIPNLRIVYK